MNTQQIIDKLNNIQHKYELNITKEEIDISINGNSSGYKFCCIEKLLLSKKYNFISLLLDNEQFKTEFWLWMSNNGYGQHQVLYSGYGSFNPKIQMLVGFVLQFLGEK